MSLATVDKRAAVAIANAHWPSDARVLALAVAIAEHGGSINFEATNTNRDGSTDYGLFQINSVHKDVLARGNWRDPTDNARMALAVWNQQGWGAWVAYKRKLHLPFMPRAKAAFNDTTNATESEQSSANESSTNENTSALKETVGVVTSSNTYYRIGLFVLGLMLTIVGLLKLAGSTSVARAVTRIAL